MTESLDGVVIVDKPVGPTSFAMVRQARQLTGVRKVGHGGTLDPLASGVLPICLGEGTKLAQFLLEADKEYLATIEFGAETDTDDRAGRVTNRRPTDQITEAAVATAMLAFVGKQTQIPPMFSALKRDGRPLYDYARAGETVERQPRHIEILEFALVAFHKDAEQNPTADGPTADFRVRCSKGTYIRTLARDLGAALGSAAHLAALRRTRSGPFDLGRAISPDRLTERPLPLVSPADALADLPTVRLTEVGVRMVTQGKNVSWHELPVTFGGDPIADLDAAAPPAGHLIRLLSPSGALVAVARCGRPEERVRTLRVFSCEVTGDLATSVASASISGAGQNHGNSDDQAAAEVRKV